MIVNHGLSKFLELWPFNDILIRDRDLFGLGSIVSILLFVLGEFLAPILISIGYKTRFFSIFPILTMFFAIVLVHMDDPFKSWEKPLLFLIGFLIILLMGPGRYSLDRRSF
tara:strand:- start:174 stop:506 length:333 start_codon:yes stop_codon:yes gene_type:complete